jgi:group I intron endonuclease
MTNIAHLYRLTSPSGKVYIGITKNAHKRWQQHALAADRGSKITIHAAIRKYGFDNFKKEILLTSTFSYVKEMEVKAVAAFNCIAPNGYNLTKGGDGIVGFKHSDKTKTLISTALIGHSVSDKTKESLSKSLKGKKIHTEDSKRKISAYQLGRPKSQEMRERLSSSTKGKRRAHITDEFLKTIQAKAAAALRGRAQVKVTCVHCRKTGGIASMTRWHFSGCSRE